MHGMLLEGMLTFLLVFVIFATAPIPGGVPHDRWVWLSDLTVTVAMLLDAAIHRRGMNPARAFGPALAAHHWTNQGIYWVGPLMGGVFAAWLYETPF